MERTDYIHEIKNILVNEKNTRFMDLDYNAIKEESDLTQDLGLDSLDKIESAMSIEDHYDIEFLDDELEKVVTFSDLVNLTIKTITEGRM